MVLDAFDNAPIEIDASQWKFVLVLYPDGEKEIPLQGDNVARVPKDLRLLAAALLLENELGEEHVQTQLDTFDLVEGFEEKFRPRARTVQQLKSALQTC